MTEPTTRLGKFLWRLSGHEVDITPRNELEECLDAIASGSGSSGGGAFVIGITREEVAPNIFRITMDKTFAEIKEAMRSGKVVFVQGANDESISRRYIIEVVSNNSDDSYTVSTTESMEYVAESENGYPIMIIDNSDTNA